MAAGRFGLRRSVLGSMALSVGLAACANSTPAIHSLVAPTTAMTTTRSPWHTLQLHCHSSYGGGTHSVSELVKMAADNGVDAMVISDHNDWRQIHDEGFRSTGSVTLIKGQEWGIVRRDTPGGDQGKVGPHAGILDPIGEDYIPTSQQVTSMIDKATARQATIVINHPKIPKHTWPEATPDPRAHAVEVWNSWFRILPGVFDDPDGDWTDDTRSILDHNQLAVTWWDGLLRKGRKLTAVGGSDFHRWPQPFAQPINIVYAPTNAKAEILQSVRAGRVAVAVDPNGPRMLVTGDDGSGAFGVQMGDSLHGSSGTLRVTVQKAAGQTVLAYSKKGKVWETTVKGASWQGDFTYTPPAGERDYVRFELRPTADSPDMSAMTNPIYFE